MKDTNDSVEILLACIESLDEPFTIDLPFEKTGIPPKGVFVNRLQNHIEKSGQYVLTQLKDGDILIHPKTSFLKDIPFRILPTEMEIDRNFIIPGHRIIPFNFPGLPVDEVEFRYKGKKIQKEALSFQWKEVEIYFTLLDMFAVPLLDFDKDNDFDDNTSVTLYTYDLGGFYKENNFKFGDTIIVKPLDLREGIFELSADSPENMNAASDEIQKVDDIFYSSLSDVLDEGLPFPSVEKQLLHAYYVWVNNVKSPPPTSMAKLISSKGEITLSMLSSGIRVFHFNDQDPQELEHYNDIDLSDPRSFEDEDHDLESINGILTFLRNNNSETVVRALILQQISKNYKLKYNNIIDYLFKDLEKPHIPPELQDAFQELVLSLYNDLLEEHGDRTPLLPLITARQKIFDILLSISLFLRSLDRKKIDLEKLPRQDIFNLMEMVSSLESMLRMFEDVDPANGTEGLPELIAGISEMEEIIPQFIEDIWLQIEGD
ncbi:MAG: hypothetical protein GY754_24380 [bacterium]|nr:hypothetical protein [bacterium]